MLYTKRCSSRIAFCFWQLHESFSHDLIKALALKYPKTYLILARGKIIPYWLIVYTQRCGSRTVEPSGGSSRGRGRTWSGGEGGGMGGRERVRGIFKGWGILEKEEKNGEGGGFGGRRRRRGEVADQRIKGRKEKGMEAGWKGERVKEGETLTEEEVFLRGEEGDHLYREWREMLESFDKAMSESWTREEPVRWLDHLELGSLAAGQCSFFLFSIIFHACNKICHNKCFCLHEQRWEEQFQRLPGDVKCCLELFRTFNRSLKILFG